MRLLHTMLRVGDLDRAIGFYTEVMGMTLLRTSDNPEYRYKLAFLGEWVLVIQGVIFVACVLLFRRGLIGELARWLRIKL